MSVAEHNHSRRALLGAAVALPLLGSEAVARVAGPLHQPSPKATAGPPPRPGEDLWRRRLAEYRVAEATVAEVERCTAGAPWEEQDAVEEEYGNALDGLYAALRRLFRVPAPDVAALAVKIEIVVAHEVATLNEGEACMAALRRDARRLAGLDGDSYE
jgi:hypothetical protein